MKHERDMSEYSNELINLFDEVTEIVSSKEQSAISIALDNVTNQLYEYRSVLSHRDWRALIEIGRSHCLFNQIQQDPISKRAFDKPNGYPGDAVLMDFIYGCGGYLNDVRNSPEVGRMIYTRTRVKPACKAVRNRRNLIVEEIGQALKYSNAARILSVGSGHLREAEQIHWGGIENLELFLAIDQDMDTLAEISARNYHQNLAVKQQSIRQILSGKFLDQDFDLIYVTGLYDYLQYRVAVRLTEILFSKLRAGGKLLIANAVPTMVDAGYMELFLDWFLVYRTEEQMRNLVPASQGENTSSSRVFLDNFGQFCFLETKKN